MRLRISNRRIARSTAGDVAILIFLGLGAVYMALPMFYAICQAFKPLNELFIFPPQFLPRHHNLEQFQRPLSAHGPILGSHVAVSLQLSVHRGRGQRGQCDLGVPLRLCPWLSTTLRGGT